MTNRLPRIPEVYFLSFVGPDYSRSSTILNFVSPNLHKKFLQLPSGFLYSVLEIYRNRRNIRNAHCLVVMSPCHILTPILKIYFNQPVILDAGWPLTDGHIARGFNGLKSLRLPLVFIIDLIAFHFADLVLLESRGQVIRVNKLFRVSKSKLAVNFTGLNENHYSVKSSESEIIRYVKKRILDLDLSTVALFRGKVNRESGFSNILSAALRLKNRSAFIFVIGSKNLNISFPSNCIVISGISDDEMKQVYLLSDIAIGQVSSHPRLKYTIPHKAFEAGYFAKAYVTSNSEGLREFLENESALFLPDSSSETLVTALLELQDFGLREKYSRNIKLNYGNIASQKLINEKFENYVKSLVSL